MAQLIQFVIKVGNTLIDEIQEESKTEFSSYFTAASSV